jgi:hypothetical protein
VYYLTIDNGAKLWASRSRRMTLRRAISWCRWKSRHTQHRVELWVWVDNEAECVGGANSGAWSE